MSRTMMVLALAAASGTQAQTTTVVVGDVRVQALSENLVRIEAKGPKGFEDRETMHVLRKDWKGVPLKVVQGKDGKQIEGPGWSVVVSIPSAGLSGVRMLRSGNLVFDGSKALPPASFLPSPSGKWTSWVMADAPRLVPPVWGATPIPPNVRMTAEAAQTSGWDTGNDAPDVYVFLNGQGYTGLRRDFLKLTGQTPMPPLWSLGLIDSRYHPYTQPEALSVIDEYRKRGIPLDGFVVDTDWRVNASHGYQIDEKLFPDMRGFFRAAHQKGVKVIFNDHPEPVGKTAFEPEEIQYRWDNLTRLMDMGLDAWWYDRNWSTHLHEPMPGLAKELWGQRVYWDTAALLRPNQRPFILTNVQGIDNGIRRYAPQPASHRYPVWWTGDTGAMWEYLQYAVANGVDFGVEALLPYVHEDTGGHWSTPTPELFARFVQFGALSPILRLHCTRGEIRRPWSFGPEAERVAVDFIKLRYRLLPTLYSAAREAYETGTPLMRRLDLEWPSYAQAAKSDQYLLGADLLLAPVTSSIAGDLRPLPTALLRTPEGRPGVAAEYFEGMELSGDPILKTEQSLSLDWKRGGPAEGIKEDKFSARFQTVLGPIPADGTYTFVLESDDGVRVWADGKLLVDEWKDQVLRGRQFRLQLKKGQTVRLKVEYFENSNDAMLSLKMATPQERTDLVTRSLWVPPGVWADLWTGERIVGPKTVQKRCNLLQIPMYLRTASSLLLAPVVQRTSLAKWPVLDVESSMPGDRLPVVRSLIEDDGSTVGYQTGKFARTTFSVKSTDAGAQLDISAAQGPGAPAKRDVNWRLRLTPGVPITHVTVDGKRLRVGEAGVRIDKVGPVADKVPLLERGPQPGRSLVVPLRALDTKKSHRVVVEYVRV